MALSLQVLYPAATGTQFDYDYYLSRHFEIVQKHMGPHIDSVQVTRGLAGGPDVPPPYYAIATMTFADKAAMDAAMAAAGPALEDIPNFTDTKPQMLIGQVAD